jgi:primosomal protein N' (replication factor Y) (superfamily II helicase)
MILQVAIPSPLRQTFDYLPPETGVIDANALQPGTRVLVSFGTRQIIGVIIAVAKSSVIAPEKLKTILAVCDTKPILSKTTLDLVAWISDYYHHPIGDVIANLLPALLRSPKYIMPSLRELSAYFTESLAKLVTIPELNKHQIQVVEAIQQMQGFNTFLLDGVTGSGKTEVYLQVIAEVIKCNKQALVLVPEINLTPQTLERFQQRFTVPIAVLHSRCTKKERLQAWLAASEGLTPIVIGTRSAVFAALKNPGIIIIDEEHDLSFRQQSGLRYSARDVAIMRAKLENIPILLGSATPALESMNNANNKRFIKLSLPERAGNAVHPIFHVIDLRGKYAHNGLSDTLIKAIEKHLQNNGQILLFLNRRGFAPTLLCRSCGWVAECKHCDARLILHQKANQLLCHHCGRIKRIPTKCPSCAADKLSLLGMGTERVETTLKELFPEVSLVRVDRDTTSRKHAIEKLLSGIQRRDYQILVGTQMLAKGHHFPDVTMVAILNVDYGLFSADFRATEHLAQLVIQVAGRAGRAEKPGEVYLQTYNPHHPMLIKLLESGYKGFTAASLHERKLARLPPFSYIALIRAEAKCQELPLQFLQEIREKTLAINCYGVEIFGPIPALMERKADCYRAQLLIQSQARGVLHEILEIILALIHQSKCKQKIKWYLEVDPAEIL